MTEGDHPSLVKRSVESKLDSMGRPPKAVRIARDRPRVLGYCRVSTREQKESGAGLDAQRAALDRAALDRNWDLEVVVEGPMSGDALVKPVLDAALARLKAHDADVLAVAKLDRMSRSVIQGASLINRARREGWSVAVLDLGVDTSTDTGEMIANVILSIAQYEKRLIGSRTRDGLAAKRAAGVRLGRPRAVDAGVRALIRQLRDDGHTWQAIADNLMAAGIPAGRGGAKWYPSTARAAMLVQA